MEEGPHAYTNYCLPVACSLLALRLLCACSTLTPCLLCVCSLLPLRALVLVPLVLQLVLQLLLQLLLWHCYTCEPDPSWEPLQLEEFREMQAAFTLPRPMLPAMATANAKLVEAAACSGVDVRSASASPGAVANWSGLGPELAKSLAGLARWSGLPMAIWYG